MWDDNGYFDAMYDPDLWDLGPIQEWECGWHRGVDFHRCGCCACSDGYESSVVLNGRITSGCDNCDAEGLVAGKLCPVCLGKGEV